MWFLFVHTATNGLGMFGYIVMLLAFFQLNLLFLISTHFTVEVGFCALIYGLYFGVVARDFAEICTDKMAAQISVSFLPVLYK